MLRTDWRTFSIQLKSLRPALCVFIYVLYISCFIEYNVLCIAIMYLPRDLMWRAGLTPRLIIVRVIGEFLGPEESDIVDI